MAERRLVVNGSGTTVGIDVGVDMDEATFDAMVERGDLTPVQESKKAAAKSQSKK